MCRYSVSFWNFIFLFSGILSLLSVLRLNFIQLSNWCSSGWCRDGARWFFFMNCHTSSHLVFHTSSRVGTFCFVFFFISGCWLFGCLVVWLFGCLVVLLCCGCCCLGLFVVTNRGRAILRLCTIRVASWLCLCRCFRLCSRRLVLSCLFLRSFLLSGNP